MGYKVKNGDQIHVTTHKNQKPTEAWLKLVKTGKARSKIRSAMKEEKRKQGEIGKESLERKLRNMKADFEDNQELLVKHFNYKSRPDLYFDIANDNFKLSELKVFIVKNGKLILEKPPEPITPDKGNIAPKDNEPKKQDGTAQYNIIIDGENANNLKYELAHCCKPVQGDDIFAYLTSNQGMKIHRTNCKNAVHLLANYGYRVLKAEWQNVLTTNFAVDLLVTGVDSGPGVIQSLTNEISNNLGINIRTFSIEGKEGIFEGKIGMFVLNKNQLNQALRAIEKLDGIQSVKRIVK